jgi:hypothetical protein
MYKSPLSFAIVGDGRDSTWMAAGANPAAGDTGRLAMATMLAIFAESSAS